MQIINSISKIQWMKPGSVRSALRVEDNFPKKTKEYARFIFDNQKFNLYKLLNSFTMLLFGAPLIFNLNWDWWIYVVLLIIGSVVSVLFQNMIVSESEREALSGLDFQYEVTFELTTQAISDLSEVMGNGTSYDMDKKRQLLHYFERAITGILEENGIVCRDIGVNLMLPVGNVLHLELFAINRPARKPIDLSLNPDLCIPGAPTAFREKKIIYIEDVRAIKYRKYFKDKRYRSVLSFPIFEEEYAQEGEILGILNIDSPGHKQFINMEFVAKKIHPALEPLLTVLSILIKRGKI